MYMTVIALTYIISHFDIIDEVRNKHMLHNKIKDNTVPFSVQYLYVLVSFLLLVSVLILFPDMNYRWIIFKSNSTSIPLSLYVHVLVPVYVYCAWNAPVPFSVWRHRMNYKWIIFNPISLRQSYLNRGIIFARPPQIRVADPDPDPVLVWT